MVEGGSGKDGMGWDDSRMGVLVDGSKVKDSAGYEKVVGKCDNHCVSVISVCGIFGNALPPSKSHHQEAFILILARGSPKT